MYGSRPRVTDDSGKRANDLQQETYQLTHSQFALV